MRPRAYIAPAGGFASEKGAIASPGWGRGAGIVAGVEVPELRPLRVAESLDVAIKIYLKHAGTLLKIVGFVVVPVQLLGALVIASTFPDAVSFDPQTPPSPGEPLDTTEFWALLAGSISIAILNVIATAIATGACLKAISDSYLGGEANWRDSLRFMRGRVASTVWITMLHTIIPTIALAALIAPGVWLWVAWSVAVPVLLMEGLKGRRALGRSFRLVRHRWWKVFGAIALGMLLALLLGGAIGAGFTFLLFTDLGDSTIMSLIVQTIANIITGVLTTPFQAALIAVIYFDLRVRKEGFDLELLAANVGAPPPTSASSGNIWGRSGGEKTASRGVLSRARTSSAHAPCGLARLAFHSPERANVT